jgi:hypothetical protein
MILKAGLIFVAIEADRISEKLQSYVKLLCVAKLCSLCNTAYFSLFYQFFTGMCTAMTGEKAHLFFVLQVRNLLKLIPQLLENMGVPSWFGKQSQSGNIRFTVRQYWLIIKINATNSVNFVVV